MEKKAKRSTRRKSATTEIAGIQIPRRLTQMKVGRPAAMILGAAALGGAFYYFANPSTGAQRRSSFIARIKALSNFRTETVMIQFNSIVSSVSGLLSNWRSSAEDVASDVASTAQSKLEEAKSEATSYARKSSAKAEDYVATH